MMIWHGKQIYVTYYVLVEQNLAQVLLWFVKEQLTSNYENKQKKKKLNQIHKYL